MGLIKRTGQAAYRETRYLVGGEGISRWWDTMRRGIFSARRSCPACQSGKMFRFDETIEGQPREFFGCSRCDHFEAVDLSDEKDAVASDSLSRLRSITEDRLKTIGKDGVDNMRRRYRINSRFQYFFSFVLLGFGFYLLVAGGSAWTLINASALALLMFAQGLRLSYRHWQLANGELYRPGAFRRWMAEGKWLI